MDAWLIWLVAAGVLLVAEMFSLQLVLVMFSVGALASSAAAALGVNLLAQSLLFAGVSIICLVFVRPLVLRWLGRHSGNTKTGIDALIGGAAVVLQPVDELRGLVKLSGEEWSAQSAHPGQSFEPGEKVYVVQIKGATALVAENYESNDAGQ